MRKNCKTLLLFAGAVLLVAGCGKQNWMEGTYSRRAGDPVVFGVGTRDMETRTVYGDVNTVSGKKIQDINWVSGDRIRVYSPDCIRASWNDSHQWADYVVNPVTGPLNRGTLSNVQANGLSWGDAGDHTFYAIYPSPGTSEAENPAGAGGAFTYSIPASQEVSAQMQYAYMLAAASASNNKVSGDAVELDFTPAFTAFEFQLRSADPDVQLLSIEIESASMALVGDATAQYDAGTDKYAYAGPARTDSNKSVSVTAATGTVLATDSDYVLTVFGLPLDLTGLTLRLTVKYPDADSPETKSLALKYSDTAATHPGEYVTFGACKKHIIKGVHLEKGWVLIYANGEDVLWDVEGWGENLIWETL